MVPIGNHSVTFFWPPFSNDSFSIAFSKPFTVEITTLGMPLIQMPLADRFRTTYMLLEREVLLTLRIHASDPHQLARVRRKVLSLATTLFHVSDIAGYTGSCTSHTVSCSMDSPSRLMS